MPLPPPPTFIVSFLVLISFISPPSKAMLRRAMRLVRLSAPGPDALLRAAWGVDIARDAMEWALSGQELFASASDAIQIFRPKNVTDFELRGQECARSPEVRIL
eukprot:3430433-Pyramimonas_sp.AAC.1